MGKFAFNYTDSDDTDDTASSVENFKKKKRFSILKYTSGNAKRKKCKVHSISEPDDEFHTKSMSKMRKLRGILKHDRERESSEEEDDIETVMPRHKFLVGRVPRPAGARPGRGGGVAIVVRKNNGGIPTLQSLQEQSSNSRRRSTRRLYRKKSF